MKTFNYLSGRGSLPLFVGVLSASPFMAHANEIHCDDHGPFDQATSLNAQVERFVEHECEEEPEVVVEAPTQVIGILRQLPSVTLNGAHHRLLLDTPVGADGWHTWATGDFTTHDQLNADQGVAEIGASRNVGSENLRVGVGIGHSSIDQDFTLGGGTNIEGNFGLIEVDYKIPDTSFIVSGILYYGEWDADVKRGYTSGGAVSSSKGSTDLKTLAFRIRLDWQDAYKRDKWSVTPRISYTGMDTESDSYTESGGAAPARFNSQDYYDHEIRIGADIDYEWSKRTEVRTILEVAHRFDTKGTISGGTLAGGQSFSLTPVEAQDTWGRLGFELSHELVEGQILRTSIFGATKGEDATLSGAVSYNVSF